MSLSQPPSSPSIEAVAGELGRRRRIRTARDRVPRLRAAVNARLRQRDRAVRRGR